MTPPPYYGQQPPPPAGNDKVTLWGVLGIVFAICCWPLGVVFSVLSLIEARKYGKPQTLAIVGFVVAGINLIVGIILSVTGALGNIMSTS